MSLLVLQPSADYAARVRRHFPDAVFLATPERAVILLDNQPLVVAADLEDLQAAHRALDLFARQHQLTYDGLTCFVCDYLPLAGHLAPLLNLPFHSSGAIGLSRDKGRAAAAWTQAGVSTPPTRLVRRAAELLDFAAQIPGPWILKPTDRSGSEWVLKVETPEELRPAHQRLHEGLEGDPYLVQRCVEGREFSADFYVAAGQATLLRLTEKYLLPQPGQAGLVGAYFPAQVPAPLQARLLDAYTRGALALGVERGIAMVDSILAEDTPYLLEMALRPGGDCLPDLCIHSTGYDPIRAAGLVALGLPPTCADLTHPEPLAALHLLASQSGLIRAIDFGALAAHPAVVQYEPYHLPGEELRCWEGSYDDRILAACVVRCAEQAQLPALIEELSALIVLELDTPTSAKER